MDNVFTQFKYGDCNGVAEDGGSGRRRGVLEYTDGPSTGYEQARGLEVPDDRWRARLLLGLALPAGSGTPRGRRLG